MTPVEELREAARVMTERANASLHFVTPEDEWWGVDGLRDAFTALSGEDEVVLWGIREDAEHIASWHPAVALAVADWLDKEAAIWDHLDALRLEVSKTKGTVLSIPYSSQSEALKLARTYLGTTP